MHSLILPLCVGAAVLLLAGALRTAWRMRQDVARRTRDTDPEWVRRKAVLTPAELTLAQALMEVLPPGTQLLVKVRLADIVTPRVGLSAGARRAAWKRLAAGSIDFLIVRAADLAPLGAAALAPSDAGDSPGNASVAEVFQRAGLPLVRIPERDVYAPGELRRRLAPLLSAAGGSAD